MNNYDVENIIWHTPNVEPLTKTEVDAELNRLQTESETRKAALLERLGLTQEEFNTLIA